MAIDDILDRIPSLDPVAMARAQARIDRLTKPVGSLGRLEGLAVRYAGITGVDFPKVPRAAIFTFAADHGVAAEGVSAYPSAVTAQMVFNFLRGGAAVNVLAAHVGADVRVVDIGVAHDFGAIPGLIARKVRGGTGNCAVEPAMTQAEAAAALAVGAELGEAAAREGVGIVGTGEMGIGNTTSSSAITALMTGRPVIDVTGRGTGVDAEGFKRKVAVVERIVDRHRADAVRPLDVLAAVGGFEIAGLAGLMLGCAAHRVPVMLDGFITGAAALIAVGLQPRCREFLFASHRSAERGHQAILDGMELVPLLDLDLRLGEGTGACLGIGLVQAAVKILTQMATFEEAGVSDRIS